MEHPAIQEVVTFAIADNLLGEEVGAAIVLADGAVLDEAELKSLPINIWQSLRSALSALLTKFQKGQQVRCNVLG